MLARRRSGGADFGLRGAGRGGRRAARGESGARGARQFIAQFGLTFPNGPDPKGQIAIDYGVYGVPETFIIDRQGTIAYKHVGAVTDRMVTEQVEPLVKP